MSQMKLLFFSFFFQENPARADGQIFNVGNPNNEVTVRQLAEIMTKVRRLHLMPYFVL